MTCVVRFMTERHYYVQSFSLFMSVQEWFITRTHVTFLLSFSLPRSRYNLFQLLEITLSTSQVIFPQETFAKKESLFWVNTVNSITYKITSITEWFCSRVIHFLQEKKAQKEGTSAKKVQACFFRFCSREKKRLLHLRFQTLWSTRLFATCVFLAQVEEPFCLTSPDKKNWITQGQIQRR